MSETSRDPAESPTDRANHNPWSAVLDGLEHAVGREPFVADVLDAVGVPAAGYHDDLVAHGSHSHPSERLRSSLEAAFCGDVPRESTEPVERAGYVTRVHAPENPRTIDRGTCDTEAE